VIAAAAAVIRATGSAGTRGRRCAGCVAAPSRAATDQIFPGDVSPMQHFVTPRAWRGVAVWQIHINRRHH
jgi:hypothetical protein